MFRARQTRHPIPYDREAAAAAIVALSPPSDVAPLIRGVAGCSPHLAAAMLRERDWLVGVWDAEPEDVLATLLGDLTRIEGDPGGPLRLTKRRAALLVGLAELGGVWSVMEAAAAWTRFADAAVAGDWRDNGANTFGRRRGGMKPETPVRMLEGDPDKTGGAAG